MVVFDELFNFPEYRLHEMRALWEFLRDRGRAGHTLALEVLSTSTRQVLLTPVEEERSFKQSCALRLMAASTPLPHAAKGTPLVPT